jgi:hypothetical protein
MNDCSGPKPIQFMRKSLERMSVDNYQYELFSILQDKRWIPEEDRIVEETHYHMFPYNYALDYINCWEAKNSSF